MHCSPLIGAVLAGLQDLTRRLTHHRLNHPIDIILFPHLRYVVITTANSNHKGLVTQALISSFMVTKHTFELPVI